MVGFQGGGEPTTSRPPGRPIRNGTTFTIR